MKIGLIGYGKMGKEIEKIAIERGHSIPLIIDVDNPQDCTPENLRTCEVIIEFTRPESAVDNYLKCFEAGVPVVSGTTGWNSSQAMVYEKCLEQDGTFFWSSNFSLGVNLFFELNRKLAELMADHPQYQVKVHEVHHTQKLDAPSGTAITLAEELIGLLPRVTGWKSGDDSSESEIPITSERTGMVPGIHTITWDSEVDYIEITHSAKSRKGLAFGAVLAAEYCQNHKGILKMRDLLNL